MSNPPPFVGVRALMQKRFLDYHHHLISPWLYRPIVIIERNRAMLERRWAKAPVPPFNGLVEVNEMEAMERELEGLGVEKTVKESFEEP